MVKVGQVVTLELSDEDSGCHAVVVARAVGIGQLDDWTWDNCKFTTFQVVSVTELRGDRGDDWAPTRDTYEALRPGEHFDVALTEDGAKLVSLSGDCLVGDVHVR